MELSGNNAVIHVRVANLMKSFLSTLNTNEWTDWRLYLLYPNLRIPVSEVRGLENMSEYFEMLKLKDCMLPSVTLKIVLSTTVYCIVLFTTQECYGGTAGKTDL